MFDEKSRAMLMLVMLNDIFADAASSVRNLRDFIASHPEMAEEIEKYRLKELLEKAEEFEEMVIEIMDELKKVVYSSNR